MRWCVLQVNTGSEMTVRDRLLEMGIRAIVPRENRFIRNGGNWNKKEYTLFTGYVFIELEYSAEMYYKIKEILQVNAFLGGGFNPSRLSLMETEWIKLLGNNGEVIEPAEATTNDNGDVVITDGVLACFMDKIKSVDRHARKAVFEISICGESKTLELSIALEDSNENEEVETKTNRATKKQEE